MRFEIKPYDSQHQEAPVQPSGACFTLGPVPFRTDHTLKEPVMSVRDLRIVRLGADR